MWNTTYIRVSALLKIQRAELQVKVVEKPAPLNIAWTLVGCDGEQPV